MLSHHGRFHGVSLLAAPGSSPGFMQIVLNLVPFTTVPQIIPGDMDRKQLAETVSRRAGILLLQNLHFHRPWWSDADAEPPRMGSRRVSLICFRFMSVVNNGFSHIHWHRGMDCVSPPKTRRRPFHGGSNPASMRDTVLGGDTQSMPLIFVGQ